MTGISNVGGGSPILAQAFANAGVSGINVGMASSFVGMGEVLFSRTLGQPMGVAQQYAASSALLGSPPSHVALSQAMRDFRAQQTKLQNYTNSMDGFFSRLGSLVTGIGNLRSTLTSLSALVNDAALNPGNAGINQAAIDTLVPFLQRQIESLRLTQDQPTFQYLNLDARVHDFVIYAADGLRIDAAGFPVDINVTQDARRAEAVNFLNNLAGLSQDLTFTITGPGGVSALIDISPTPAEIPDALTGVSALNTASVSFDLTGSVGTVNITILGLEPGRLADAITGISPTLNTGNTVFQVGSNLQGASGATQVTALGGGQAQLLGGITAITPSGNTGGVTFELSGALTALQGFAPETITISGGTRADLADAVSVNPTFNTGDTTIRITGTDGVSDVTVLGGAQAFSASVLSTFIQNGNTGSRFYDITGALGTANVRISGGSGPETTALITPNVGADIVLTGNTSFSLQLAGSGSAPSNGTKTLTLTAGTYTIAQAIAALQAQIDGGSAPLKNRVQAVAVPGGIGFITPLDNGLAVSLSYSQGVDPDSVLQDANQTFTGSIGDDATAAAARVNAVSGTTGVYAVVNGAAVDFYSGTNAGNRFYGTGATIVVNNITGGNAGVVATVNTAGTDGDSRADIITKINAVQGTTGVFALAGTTANAISFSSTRTGAVDILGSSAEVTVATISGGTAGATTNSSAFGTDGDNQAQIIAQINAVSASTGVEAFVDGVDIGLRSAVSGVTDLFGSGAFVTIANVTGGDAATIIASNANGTDGDTVADVINKITAAAGGTGVTAAAGSAGAVSLAGSTGGSTEFIEIVSVSNPVSLLTLGASATNATDFGDDAEDRDTAIANINAVSHLSGVEADVGSDAFSITLRSTASGGGATVQISNIVDPLPAAQVEFSATLTDTGFTPTQAAVIAAINAAGNSVGVEAYADAEVSLRSFLYGSGAGFTINPVSDPGNVLGGGITRNGTDAVATIAVDGGVAVPITADVHRFDFNINGVIGAFTVPEDSIFDPTSITVQPSTSQYLSTTNEFGFDLTRFNFNVLNQGFLGTLLSDDLNLQTRGTNGNPGIAIPLGGITAIDLNSPTGVQAAQLLLTNALDQLDQDESLASSLRNRLLSPIVAGGELRDAAYSGQSTAMQSLQDALAAHAVARAEFDVAYGSAVLAQISALYPTAASALLSGV